MFFSCAALTDMIGRRNFSSTCIINYVQHTTRILIFPGNTFVFD